MNPALDALHEEMQTLLSPVLTDRKDAPIIIERVTEALAPFIVDVRNGTLREAADVVSASPTLYAATEALLARRHRRQ